MQCINICIMLCSSAERSPTAVGRDTLVRTLLVVDCCLLSSSVAAEAESKAISLRSIAGYVVIPFAALMCQQKHQMRRCSAGSFEPLTRHLVPITAIDVFARRWAIDRAAIRRWRRRTCFIRAADVWLLASAPWLIVVCVRFTKLPKNRAVK